MMAANLMVDPINEFSIAAITRPLFYGSADGSVYLFIQYLGGIGNFLKTIVELVSFICPANLWGN